MKTQELLDRLCFDGEGSPYPIEALYTLEGMQYVELIGLLKAAEKGDPLPPWQELAGTDRRKLAKAVGAATPEKEVEVARGAGTALDGLAKQLRRAKIELPASSRDELLRTAAALFSSLKVEPGVGELREVLRARLAVETAALLIHEVDQHINNSAPVTFVPSTPADGEVVRLLALTGEDDPDPL